jgi:broad specificity phosphatase PhoE
MKIYIVRHGQSISNKEGYIAFYHTGLTEKGKLDSRKLGKRLVRRKIKFDAIFCSPLYRALQTLDEILKAGLEINPNNIFVSDLLKEINRREFEGRPREEYYQAREKSGVDPNDFRCREGESENDVRKRAIKFQKLLEQSQFETILVVSHGHFIAQFTSLFNLKGLGHNEGATLSLLEWKNNQCKVILWNNKQCLL